MREKKDRERDGWELGRERKGKRMGERVIRLKKKNSWENVGKEKR